MCFTLCPETSTNFNKDLEHFKCNNIPEVYNVLYFVPRNLEFLGYRTFLRRSSHHLA